VRVLCNICISCVHFQMFGATMELSTPEQMLIEQRVTNAAKSSGVAYILCLFLGGFGAHRFYLGHPTSGMAMLGLMVLGVGLAQFPVGALFFITGVIWIINDLFLIPRMVQNQTNAFRESLHRELSNSNLAAAS